MSGGADDSSFPYFYFIDFAEIPRQLFFAQKKTAAPVRVRQFSLKALFLTEEQR
jgi:hypothetical protein